jgi:hypothetical protein
VISHSYDSAKPTVESSNYQTLFANIREIIEYRVQLFLAKRLLSSWDLSILQDFQLKHLLMNISFKKLKNSE